MSSALKTDVQNNNKGNNDIRTNSGNDIRSNDIRSNDNKSNDIRTNSGNDNKINDNSDKNGEGEQAELCYLPIKLRRALLPFQRLGVKYGLEKEGRLLIADEMGLGKTVQALCIAYKFKDEWPLLIVAPASMR